MTRDELTRIQRSVDDATGALGVAGEAMTLGNAIDAQAALIRAGEALKKCKEMLGAVQVD
jgi:hypothetical protein